MNKKFIITLFVCCGILLAIPAVADDDAGTIVSSAVSSIEVEPDTVSFSAAIKTENKDLKKAIEENNEKAQKVYQTLKETLGDEGKIKTTGFRVNQVYEYDKAIRKRRISRYEVSNEVRVETKQIDKVSEFIETAINKGANRINSLSFTIEDKEKYCGELLKKATIKAKEKAKVIAEALGVKITGIKRVNSDCNSRSVRPVGLGRGMMAETAADISIEPGDVDMNASVTIEFLIQN